MNWRSKASFKKNANGDLRRKKIAGAIQRKISQTRLTAPNPFHLLPNAITVLALCSGLSAVRFALMDRWEAAIFAIALAALLDAMDGRIARLLGSTSRFGAELDSLSDFISFGVSPALVMYLFSLQQWKGIGWAVGLIFSVCGALRLARFNTISIEGTAPAWSAGFFVGVPIPVGAILSLFPLFLFFEFRGTILGDVVSHPFFVSSFLIMSGGLMVSRLPTFSLKKVTIPHKYVLPVLLGMALLAAAILSEPWILLSLFCLGYLLTIPFSVKAYKKLEREMTSLS
jgi:CDP-diacylglycerol--serine O-phosphatidyltransferase